MGTKTKQAEFCPPIDTSLLRSILSDFDNETVNQARPTLDLLKQSALVEDSLAFDASGTGGQPIDHEYSSRSADSQIEASAGLSTGTETQSLESATTASRGQTTSENGGVADHAGFEHLDELDEETKLQVLMSLFGEQLPQHIVRHTLRSCNGRFDAAMDGLLNQVYFHEAENSNDGSKLAHKGIDAFSEDNVGRRQRKGKAKGRNSKGCFRATNLAADSGLSNGTSNLNRWQKTTEDIEFIATRTGLSNATISSLYHKNGGSISTTIAAVLKLPADKPKPGAGDDIMQYHARELQDEFPTVSSRQATALVQLTHPSTASAHELAKAMTRSPAISPGGSIQIIIPRYAPPPDALEPESPRSARSGHTKSSSLDMSDAVTRANEYTARSGIALSQASSAHRLSKSNHLMGGAAAYYADMRREYSALAYKALADVADGTAEAQSSVSQLDLHNIDVVNAVRIARTRTSQWWSNLGESRVNGRIGAETRQTGFSIVVGRGVHSQGGKARIGPAVAKMLKDEGWKFERQEAVILVKGRVSR
jgi:hypothetical protein